MSQVVDKLYDACDALTTLVAVVDGQGRVRYANTALQSVLGLAARHLLGQQLADRFVPQADGVLNAIAGIQAQRYASLRYEAQLKTPAGEALPVHVMVSPGLQSAHWLVELIPVEQQVRQDREARLLAQAQSHKEWVRNMAHEIKNPLGGIRGAAQLLALELAESGTPTARYEPYTQVIVREVDRLQDLLDRLLKPHRQPHVVGDVNIHAVCEQVRSVVLAEFGAGLRIARDYDISIPEFRGDHEQLVQAVLNIAQNAAQALSEQRQLGQARIIFKTRVVRQVTLAGQRHRLALALDVADNGPGIAPALRERLFEPLVSAREGGLGLGLTLAQNFVQQHQGHIDCESQPGRTVFRIWIPLP